jgi:hypothetical protein
VQGALHSGSATIVVESVDVVAVESTLEVTVSYAVRCTEERRTITVARQSP